MFRRIVTLVILFLFQTEWTFAAHPLITDDTGTQGRGKFQVEFNGEFSDHHGHHETEVSTTLCAGLGEPSDLVVTAPYLSRNPEGERSEDGMGDISIEMKWKFYENRGLSFAWKPGIVLATGDEKKGLGEGKKSYSLFLIGTKEMESFVVHLNLGYLKNRQELRDSWHGCLAAEYRVSEKLTMVTDVGMERNPDRESDTDPAFVLGGMIYSVNEDIDVDCGIKAGLTKAEPDYSILVGLAVRF